MDSGPHWRWILLQEINYNLFVIILFFYCYKTRILYLWTYKFFQYNLVHYQQQQHPLLTITLFYLLHNSIKIVQKWQKMCFFLFLMSLALIVSCCERKRQIIKLGCNYFYCRVHHFLSHLNFAIQNANLLEWNKNFQCFVCWRKWFRPLGHSRTIIYGSGSQHFSACVPPIRKKKTCVLPSELWKGFSWHLLSVNLKLIKIRHTLEICHMPQVGNRWYRGKHTSKLDRLRTILNFG